MSRVVYDGGAPPFYSHQVYTLVIVVGRVYYGRIAQAAFNGDPVFADLLGNPARDLFLFA